MSRSPHGRGERTGYLVEQNASPSVGYLRLGRVRERDRQPRGASGTNSATMRSPVAGRCGRLRRPTTRQVDADLNGAGGRRSTSSPTVIRRLGGGGLRR